MTPLRKRMIEELRVRNLSDITTRLYVGAAERFAKYHGCSPDRPGPEEIRKFFIYLLDRKPSVNTIQLYRAALRFLYVNTLHRKWFEEEVGPIKRRLRLPTVLSADEITRMLDRTTNLKHWTLMATLYATGLRVSELVRLKVADIDSQRMLVHVREGKGRKPRDIGLSPALLERLRIYWRREKPKEWLFPSSQHSDRHLDDRTIRLICRQAARRAEVKLPTPVARTREWSQPHRPSSLPASRVRDGNGYPCRSSPILDEANQRDLQVRALKAKIS